MNPIQIYVRRLSYDNNNKNNNNTNDDNNMHVIKL